MTGALRIAHMANLYDVNAKMAGYGYAEIQVIAAIRNCEFYEDWRPKPHTISIGEIDPSLSIKDTYVQITPGVGMENAWDLIREMTVVEY